MASTTCSIPKFAVPLALFIALRQEVPGKMIKPVTRVTSSISCRALSPAGMLLPRDRHEVAEFLKDT